MSSIHCELCVNLQPSGKDIISIAVDWKAICNLVTPLATNNREKQEVSVLIHSSNKRITSFCRGIGTFCVFMGALKGLRRISTMYFVPRTESLCGPSIGKHMLFEYKILLALRSSLEMILERRLKVCILLFCSVLPSNSNSEGNQWRNNSLTLTTCCRSTNYIHLQL